MKIIFNISKKNRKAFTLLEILVSSTLTAIIFVIVFSVFWTGLKSQKHSREIAQRYMGARLFLDSLVVNIRSAAKFDFPEYENFVWEVTESNDSEIKKKLSLWELCSDCMRLSIAGKPPILRTTYYVKEEMQDEEIQDAKKKRVVYKKSEPIYPKRNSRIYTVEGPIIEGDFDLEIEYPIDKEHPEGNKEKLPVKVTIFFKIDNERELIRDVYLVYYKKETQQ